MGQDGARLQEEGSHRRSCYGCLSIGIMVSLAFAKVEVPREEEMLEERVEAVKHER